MNARIRSFGIELLGERRWPQDSFFQAQVDFAAHPQRSTTLRPSETAISLKTISDALKVGRLATLLGTLVQGLFEVGVSADD